MLNWAESIGALAVILNAIGYRQNDVNAYRLWVALALAAISTHFFLLGAMAAGIGCALACVRNIIAMRTQHWLVAAVFVTGNLGFLGWEFFILEHSALVFIAYASSIIFTLGTVLLNDATRIRQWFILAEGLGLIYALSVGSIFGSVFNIVNLSSIGIKLWQDKKMAEPQREDPSA